MDHPRLSKHLARILAEAKPRWLPRADEPGALTFVRDDGTGDVELQCQCHAGRLAIELQVRGNVVDSLIIEPEHASAETALPTILGEWLAAQVDRLASNRTIPSDKSRQVRFTVAFEAAQHDALRVAAASRNISIAEFIRDAVSHYMDKKPYAESFPHSVTGDKIPSSPPGAREKSREQR